MNKNRKNFPILRFLLCKKKKNAQIEEQNLSNFCEISI